MSLSTRTALLSLSAALTLTLAACGNDDDITVTPPPGAGASSQGAGEIAEQHNETDIEFIRGMTPHHEGALAMAELAPTRAESPEVKELAEKIAAAQGPEIEAMQAMADAWDIELEGGAAHGGGHSSGMMGDDAAVLEKLSGAAFDREFLERMIPHHESALPMAQAELDGGENPQAQELATEIIRSQTAEIAEMTQLLTEL